MFNPFFMEPNKEPLFFQNILHVISNKVKQLQSILLYICLKATKFNCWQINNTDSCLHFPL